MPINILEKESVIESWDNIKSINQTVTDYLQDHTEDLLIVSKINIIFQELLENVLKFAPNNQARILLSLNRCKHEIKITISNQADQQDGERVMKIVDEMQKASDPYTYYYQIIRNRKMKSEKGGGLGLARIFYETKAEIKAQYEPESSEIIISVIYHF